jgi:hypothetical protein
MLDLLGIIAKFRTFAIFVKCWLMISYSYIFCSFSDNLSSYKMSLFRLQYFIKLIIAVRLKVSLVLFAASKFVRSPIYCYWSLEIKKCEVGVASYDITSVPDSVKIGELVEEFKRDTPTETTWLSQKCMSVAYDWKVRWTVATCDGSYQR